MKSYPRISFVIPAHNSAHFISDALESLLAQTIGDWEAVIVDDHSEDNVEEIVSRYRDERFRFFRLPDISGQGISCARNYGNLMARSDLIAVLDSDDLAKPIRAERALASYGENKWDFYCTWRETLNLSEEEMIPLTEQKVIPTKWDSELFKVQSFVTHSSVVYTRMSALEIPYNSAIPALVDYDLISRFIVSGKKMFLDPIITVTYRRFENQGVTISTNREYRLRLLHAIRSWRGWENEDVHPDN